MICRATWRPPWIAGWATCGSTTAVAVRRRGDVADGEHVGPSGRSTRSGSTTIRPPRPIGDAERAGQRLGGDARRPHRRVGRDHRAVGEVHTRRLDPRDADAEAHVDAAPAQRGQRARRRALGERREQAIGHLDEHDPRPARRAAPGSRGEHLGVQLEQPAGHLHARRPATGDDDVDRATATSAGSLAARSKQSSRWARSAERVVEVLERERVLRDTGHAEVVRHRAGGDDERVVRRAGRRPPDGSRVTVRASRSTAVTLAIRVRTLPWRRTMPRTGIGDVVGVEPGRRHLVQQRLERVEVVGVDEHDVDRFVGQAASDRQSAEPGADDHDPLPAGRGSAVVGGRAPSPQ